MFFLLLRNTTKKYFEAIDIISGELERRFLQESFSFVRQTENLLLDSANAKSASLPEKVEFIYHKDIDMDKLKLQLKMLPDAVKVTPTHGVPIKQVTHIQQLCVKYLISSQLSRSFYLKFINC